MWLDSGGLSGLVGLTSRVLVLGCSAQEVALFEARRPGHIDCVSADAEDLEDAAAAATERGIVMGVHGAPPRAAYDLVLVAPRHLHTQPQLVPALKGVAGLLSAGGVGVVGCDAAVGNAGLAHVRRVLSLLLEP